MSALLFLALALVVSLVGTGILWYQHRQPNTYDAGIREFRREMEALRPPDDGSDPRRRGR
jgi:hypothetical protein